MNNLEVIASLQTEGMHFWPDAQGSFSYLRHPHRHIFHLRCGFPVTDPKRQLEITLTQENILSHCISRYGTSEAYGLEHCIDFGPSSCEHIALELLSAFKSMSWCEVLEDGEGGAIARR